MRLLHVSHQYYPAIGGAERYITDLSEELARRGHVTDVYTSRSLDYHTWENCLPEFDVVNGVRVHRFRSVKRTAVGWRVLRYGLNGYANTRAAWYQPFIWAGNGPVCPGMVGALLHDAPTYDLVHIVNLHYAHAWLAYKLARARNLPVVISPLLHAEQWVTHDISYMWKMLCAADAIITMTVAERDYLLDRACPAPIVVGGSGIRLADFPVLEVDACRAYFGIPPQARVLLFLGRKADYKGLDLCLRAFAELRAQYPSLYFLAIGPETDFSQCLWREYGDLPGLIVRPAVTTHERFMALAACDVLALPSVGESFGIVYLEAWAYRKPVIGARIDSVASLVTDGLDGVLVAPHDAADVARALSWLLEHESAARVMGEQGRLKLERRYTVERIADIVEGCYARVLRKRRTFASGADSLP